MKEVPLNQSISQSQTHTQGVCPFVRSVLRVFGKNGWMRREEYSRSFASLPSFIPFPLSHSSRDRSTDDDGLSGKKNEPK
jgi:hypothetical protein